MSKVVGLNCGRRNSCYVETNDGNIYYIDSCWTMDHGYETMVFEAANHDGNFAVVSFADLLCYIHDSEETMVLEHKWLIENLEEAFAEVENG